MPSEGSTIKSFTSFDLNPGLLRAVDEMGFIGRGLPRAVRRACGAEVAAPRRAPEHARGPDVLAFTRTKHRANRLAEFLARNRVSAERIHSNRSQWQRTQALVEFKAGKIRVLVATDIAARGIDTPH